MDVALGLLFGVISMLCWGTSEFLGAVAVKKINLFKSCLIRGLFSIVLLLILFPLFGGLAVFTATTIALIIVAGILGSASNLIYFKAFKEGEISIISPISSLYPVIVVLMSVLLLKEALTSVQVAAIVIAVSGSVLTSFRLKDILRLKKKKFARGVDYAFLSVFTGGAIIFVIGFLSSQIGWYLATFLFYAACNVSLFAYSRASGKDLSFPLKSMMIILIVGGIMDVIAVSAYSFGTLVIGIAIAGVVSSVYPMVTIILAKIFYKEKLEVNQLFGIGMILVALVMLAL